MNRFLVLARVLTSTAARSAAPTFVPTYFGLGVLCVIIFGPNGMPPSELTRAALTEPAASIALWGAWLLLTAPIARATLEIPETFVLRSMPVPRWYFLVISVAHLVIVEALWIALWAVGQGPLGALAAASGAAGAHGLLIARSRRPLDIAAAAALALAIGFAAPLPLLALISIAAAWIGISAAFRRAPERDARVRRTALPSALPAALASAHLLAIRRGDASVFIRGLLLTALGGLTTPFIARSYEITDTAAISALSLAVAAGTLSIATSGVAAAILRAERRARWLLDTSATSGLERVLAASLAAASTGLLFGLLHGAFIALGAGAPPLVALRFIGLATIFGVILGIAAAWLARLSDIEGPRRGGRALVRSLVFAGASIIALSALGELALLVIAAAALLASGLSSRAAAALPTPLCAHSSASRARSST